jgi:predicted unusual protein kinase regulating ubiquinone biosynthesis (AarF/ABC1/UbiB family)
MSGEISIDYEKPLGGSRRSQVYLGVAPDGRAVAVKTLAQDASIDVRALVFLLNHANTCVNRSYWIVLSVGRI